MPIIKDFDRNSKDSCEGEGRACMVSLMRNILHVRSFMNTPCSLQYSHYHGKTSSRSSSWKRNEKNAMLA